MQRPLKDQAREAELDQQDQSGPDELAEGDADGRQHLTPAQPGLHRQLGNVEQGVVADQAEGVGADQHHDPGRPLPRRSSR